MAISGSQSVAPEISTTYTATATGPGGTSTKSLTITVVQPTSVLGLQAEPNTILAGESATLSWTSENVDTLSLNQGIGGVDRASARKYLAKQHVA